MEAISLTSVIIGLAILVLLFSGMNIIEGVVGPYSSSMGSFISKNLLIIMTGSVYGIKLRRNQRICNCIYHGSNL